LDSCRIKVSDDVIAREVDGEAVLISLDSGFYYSLNRVGCFIFNQILKTGDFNNILEEIRGRFEVAESEAREDLEGFIESLEQEKIVRVCG
jgi:Coenzyme PQQ synthesis protein D (PqqD)